MVRRLCVTLPSQQFNLASFQLILDHFQNLQDIILKFPYKQRRDLGYLFNPSNTVMKKLLNRGVTSCISNQRVTMFSSPTTLTPDLFRLGLQGNAIISVHQSLQQDLPNILQLATNSGVTQVYVTKLTGWMEVESSLKKVSVFSIMGEVGENEEVLEEEVKAANHLLDLLADTDRRGRLCRVQLSKVDLNISLTLNPILF